MIVPIVRFSNRSRILWVSLFLLPITVMLEIAGIWSNPEHFGKFPLGHDFVAFWVAAKLYAAGGADFMYDLARVGALQAEVSVRPGHLFWHYPPTYLMLILPLAPFGFAVGYVLFTAANLAVLGSVARRVMAFPGLMGWATLFGAPVMVAAFVQGQNGVLFAGLLIAGMCLRDTRPWAAAICIALLLAKPQYGVLIPFALLVARDWGQIFRITACCAAFLGVCYLAFGSDIWQSFLSNLWMLDHVLDDHGMLSQMPTVWAAAVMAGLDGPWVPTLHAATAWLALTTVCWVWASNEVSKDVKLATLLISTLLISPYAFRYDMVVTLAGTLLLVRQARLVGARPLVWFGLGLMWILPAVFPPFAESTNIQLGPLVSLIGLSICCALATERRWASSDSPKFRTQRIAVPAE